MKVNMMRYIHIDSFGGPEVLSVKQGPIPKINDADVLIKVAAAGVNRPDIEQRKGKYPPPPGASNILGLEIAGTIVEVGSKVDNLSVDDEICALVAGGGYAEYCVAPANQCLPIPKGLSLIEAASLPETFFTVWSNVFERGKLTKGEVFLVQGGSSGIGVAAIQLAHAWGCRVYATAGNEEKCKFCESLGAAKAIDYTKDDFVAVIQKDTNDAGVDIILDMVGGDYVPREIQLLREEGRLVFINAMKGTNANFNIWEVMSKRLTLTGSTLRNRSNSFKACLATALLKNVWPLLENKSIKPIIHQTYPLENVADAHRSIESSQHIGKIILTL